MFFQMLPAEPRGHELYLRRLLADASCKLQTWVSHFWTDVLYQSSLQNRSPIAGQRKNQFQEHSAPERSIECKRFSGDYFKPSIRPRE